MKKIAPVRMWCIAIIGPRSTWLHPHTINRTRKGAADEWLADWPTEYQEKKFRERNKTWRTVPIIVSAEEA